ncbi:SH3 domain-containing protein [Chitinophaga silvisoli]|uniref:SH3 domain-containing protein n=2 Tax=Chitinophaga silvisoli TaxID=2291814 RepID=A0A3E1P4M2_9BACT|nr:SH3 domain-containing protein [Chitinophaga silvisoli]
MRIYLISIIAFILMSCNTNYSPNLSVTQKSNQSKLYTLTENGIILRAGPGEQYEKIINEKASQIIKDTEYAEVDKSVLVNVEEVNQQWSKIRVVRPDWLTDSHVGWVQTKYLIDPENVPKPATIPRKLNIFNNINVMRQKLSGNDIGNLHDWINDDLGYMSATDYYRFGNSNIQNGMYNDLAYYLESENENYVETLSLVLNIFNDAEEKLAMEKFNQIAEKTFFSLGIKAPPGLRMAILNKKEFSNKGNMFNTELILKKSKIDTWELTISAK